MSGTIKITNLPNAGVLDGTERAAIVMGGVTKQCTTLQIAGLVSDLILNVENYGAIGNGSADCTDAFADAWNAAIAANAAIWIPAGRFLIKKPLPLITAPISILGTGSRTSQILIDPSMSGTLISASDLRMKTDYEYTSYTIPSTAVAQMRVNGIGIVGNRTTVNVQNGLVFYDRCDFIEVSDFRADYVAGWGLGSGRTLQGSIGWLRESDFRNIHIRNCGTSSLAACEFYSAGNQDATNEVCVYDLRVVFPFGTGLRVANANASIGIRNIFIYGLMLHGQQTPAAPILADLMTIGDPVLTGIVSSMTISGLSGNAAYDGFYTVRLTAPSPGSQPFNISIDAAIQGGANGIAVDAGRNCFIHMPVCAVDGNALKVASSTTVGQNICFNGNGAEQSFTYDIDASSASRVHIPIWKEGNPSAAATVTAQVPDATAAFGNTRGAGAVDLQTIRASAAQVASGVQSALLGGNANTASGTQCAVVGGLNNSAGGNYAMVSGRAVDDRSRYGNRTHASGNFTGTRGEAQESVSVLRGISTDLTGVQLTSDQAAAGSHNIVNLADSSAYEFAITVIGRAGASSDVARYTVVGAILQGANVATAALVGLPTITKTQGTAGTATWTGPTLTADTTNGGLNLTCVGDTSVTVHWVAKVAITEVV